MLVKSEAYFLFALGMLTRKATSVNLLISTRQICLPSQCAVTTAYPASVCVLVLHAAQINLLGSALFRTASADFTHGYFLFVSESIMETFSRVSPA